MFHGFKKTKGVISIFLVIILVPMLTASSLFVDVSKMVLAHSVAESAADLSLNTVMTHFDKKLNEYYGLIASAQSMDDAYDTAKDFFVSCMKSQEISEEDASNLTNALNKYLFSNSSEGFSDFLGIYTDEDSLDVEPIKNGNLANPAVFKTQVVEFMKYRGPINAVTSFFDFLKSNSEQLTQMDEITEMTEKKQEFYEAESGLMQTLYELYLLLKQYDELKLTADFLNTIHGKIKHGGGYETEYKKIHDEIVTNLINTEWYNGKYEKTEFKKSSENTRLITKKEKVTVTSGDKTVKVAIPDVQRAAEEMIRAYDTYAKQANEVNTKLTRFGACDNNGYCVYCRAKDQINDIQYFGIVGGSIEDHNLFSDFKTAVNVFDRAYLNFVATCTRQEALENQYGEEISGYLTYDIDLVGLSTMRSEMKLDGYEKVSVEDFLEKAEEVRNRIYKSGTVVLCQEIDNHLAAIAGSLESYENRSANVRESLSRINKDIENYRDTLSKASKTLEEALKKAGEVSAALKKYKSGLDAWDAAANKSSLNNAASDPNGVVKTDRDEIEIKRNNTVTAESKNAKLLQEIKDEEVTDFVNRLTAIKTRIDFLYEGLYCCTYGEKCIAGLTIESMIGEIKNSKDIDTSQFMKSDVEKNRSAFSKLYKTYEDDASMKEKVREATTENDPEIKEGQLKFRDRLYKYFKEAENDRPSDKTDEQAKEEKEKLKKAGKEDNPDYESGSVGGSANTEISKAQGLPSNGGGKGEKATPTNKLSEISKFVTSLFKDFKATASSAMVNLRDDLLFSDYVMSMFSYDTYEREGVLDYAIEEKDYKLKSVIGWSADMANYSKDWSTNDDPTFHYNKSLRNNPINTSSCFSYGNEVEYILYGGGNAKNKSAAYVNIYAIRFACNLIPVFKEYWKSPTVASLATSISSATLGIIPVPAVKLLICLGILAAESAVDLAALRQGIGVKFIKTVGNGGNELFIDVDGWLKKALSGEDSGNKNGAIGTELPYFRYSDYLRFFLILKLLGSGENGVCLRTADVVQVNMAKLLNPGEGKGGNQFSLSKSFVYFKLSANVKVKPLMLSLSINASDANPYTTLSELASFDYEMIRGY